MQMNDQRDSGSTTQEPNEEEKKWVPLWIAFNGLDAKNAEEQANAFMESQLIGLLRGSEETVRRALCDQFRAAEARGKLVATRQSFASPSDAELPCDVVLAPATVIKKGCSMQALLVAIERRREGEWPEKIKPQVTDRIASCVPRDWADASALESRLDAVVKASVANVAEKVKELVNHMKGGDETDGRSSKLHPTVDTAPRRDKRRDLGAPDVASLRALVKRWRANVARQKQCWGNAAQTAQLQSCADQLSAALDMMEARNG